MYKHCDAVNLNVKIVSITDLQGEEKASALHATLRNFRGYIPMILKGCPMIVMYPGHGITKLTTTAVEEYSYDKKAHAHVVRTMNSIYTMEDDYNPEARKRAKARIYTVYRNTGKEESVLPDAHGYLFAYGKYPTKIHACDLPDWYVCGTINKQYSFISAKGVKHLLYKPNYCTNRLFDNDMLFISYDEPIAPVSTDGVDWYAGYDECISGSLIPVFVSAVKKFSQVNADDIQEELEKKLSWYEAQKR